MLWFKPFLYYLIGNSSNTRHSFVPDQLERSTELSINLPHFLVDGQPRWKREAERTTTLSPEAFKQEQEKFIEGLPENQRWGAERVLGNYHAKVVAMNKDLAGYDASLKYLKFERNLRYAVERFGALIEPMYQDSKKLKDAASKAYDSEIEKRVDSLAEIVTSLAKSAVKHGQKFDVIVEWKKLKKLEIPFAALTVIPQIEGKENYTNDLQKAKKLHELLTSLITAESEEEAQTVWNNAHIDWKEWANVIDLGNSSIRIEPSPEDKRVIKQMAEVLSAEARKAWAYRTDNIMEIVDYVATKKAQATVVETQTDYYKKCDWILHVRSNHHRIKPILDWMKNEWTEENGYKGFSRDTPMSEKIRTFCEEDSHLWTEACQGPHARFIDTAPLCKLSPEEKEKYLQEWSGNDEIRAGVIRKLMTIFDRDLVRGKPKEEDTF